ncbi:SGNH/GDSL hydrolase family protein [Flavobacterium sp. AC]|uniref:SGNH/GDSL hydrolase family protein n=1 Tax=Flavobacterium azizsancarii TaxID=2961580 RepID=A0ABT4W6I3_9FLAO|nr:SGNH/GDSL hydrolase family protein [Flavobacterium azizsancarii]MDA6068173.1 SGNH/GDSL hydrolase family protein [Flavobacterium azizsancarii]
MRKNIKLLLLVSLTFVACNNDDSSDNPAEVPVVPGSAVFTKYIALGDSFAAGYSDNALFKKGQEGSYTNIMAQQFVAAGGGAFTTPFMNDNLGGLLLGGNVVAATRLYFNGQAPVNVAGKPTTEVTTHLTGTFGNLGVPGAKSFHLIASGYGNVAGVASGAANPYFARFASSPSTTILADAVVQDPTFFSLFIGGNDVLAYATSGGIGKDQTGNMNPATYGSNDITDPAVFASVYSGLVTSLTAKGAKGVVANLPYITTLPYFTTVPFNPAPLTAALATQLNAGYAVYNGGLKQMVANKLLTQEEATRRTVNFIAGNNAVVVVDSYLTNLMAYGLPSYRQATKEDLIILSARTFIGTTVGGDAAKVNGLSVPLADNWVLTKDEIAEVKKATDAYNVTIKRIADEKGLAFVDTGAVMTQLSSGGVRFGNFTMSSTYVTGGAFSLDGVHPSARGYGLIANIFIDAINAKYGSTLRHVDLGIYPIQYPATIQ